MIIDDADADADNDFLLILNNDDNYFKMYYIKIEHFFNKIVINNDNSIKQPVTSFHQKDGLPIKLSIESFLVILITCNHKVTP